MKNTNRRVLRFSLRLVTNTIVSQSSATSGDHQCLDFIPGAALLGVAASRLYSNLPAEASDVLFQSGRVRFTDALAEVQGQPGWPMPLCWHHIKGEDALEAGEAGNRLDPESVFDPSRYSIDEGLQPKQLRSGYVTTNGAVVNVEKDFELKTAINPETGGAAQSQLFGYQSLRAGQCFQFSVIADADVDETLLKQLSASLSGTARIGRSRSAQFGQVEIEPIASIDFPESRDAEDGKLLRLWLVSDLALMDDNGNPLLMPTAAAFGLAKGARWLAESSFLRTRSYAPFNAKRRCHDLQRQVICRGSVLVFRLPEALNSNQKTDLQCAGQYQEAGLGQVIVNPALLASNQPVFGPAITPAVQQEQPAPSRPDSVLLRFLGKQVEGVEQGEQIEGYVQVFVAELHRALKNAAAWAGLPEGALPADVPNRSQWGKIREVALANEGQPDALRRELFETDHALLRAREGQSAWRLPTGPGEILADRIRDAMDKHSIPPEYLSKALARACTHLMRDQRLYQAENKEVIHESK
jgi:CRISPR-associated protein Csx10